MNAREILQGAMGSVGVGTRNAFYSGADVLAAQFGQLLNEAARELRSMYPWQAMTQECTFLTVAAENQGTILSKTAALSLPECHHILNETFWNRTKGYPIVGPVDGTTWQGYKATAFVAPQQQYRIRGNSLFLISAPGAGESVAFEYVTKAFATDVAGTVFKNAITADTDLLLLDDEILQIGVIYRWKKTKGFTWEPDKQRFDQLAADAFARDGTKQRKNLSAGFDDCSGVKTAIPRLIGS